MSVLERELRSRQVPPTRQLFPPTPAVQLVEEMRALRAADEPAGVWDVLAAHPGLDPDKALLTDLACEEFTQRRAAGEELDCGDFAAEFPAVGASLHKVLITRAFFEANADLLGDEESPLPWPEPGDCLKGFYVLQELGRGSFARVFLAQQPEVAERHVVVKFSFLDAAREADALGRLCHPNIVPILSLHSDEKAGWTAVCMPYHGTATLAEVLDRLTPEGRLPARGQAILDAVRATPLAAEPAREAAGPHALLRRGYLDAALHLATQLADAVAYVHEHKICHRDLKPANVLLTPDGRPLLLDFNLSCPEEFADQELGGTLPYMAPEQIRGLLREKQDAAVDSRCDVFALGVILRQLLTGQHPFLPFPKLMAPREVARWLIRQHEAGAAPCRQSNSVLDPAVARLLDRCLAADPAQRPTARALAEALRHALTWPHRLARSVRSHRTPLIGAATLALGALLILAYQLAAGPSASVRHLRAAEEAYRQGRHAEAAEQFSRVLERDGSSAPIHFARGRALFRLGETDRALADFRAADQRAKDGKVKAAIAACYHHSQLDPRIDYNLAIFYYTQALEAGYATARVYNNLGYCQEMRGQRKAAAESIQQALQADPNLQPAYYNRAKLAWRVDYGSTLPIPNAAGLFPPLTATLSAARGDRKRSLALVQRGPLADLQKALSLGPQSGELHLSAARAYALAVHLGGDASLREHALHHALRAVHFGCAPDELRRDPFLAAALEDSTAFQQLREQPPPGNPSFRPALRLLDPIED